MKTISCRMPIEASYSTLSVAALLSEVVPQYRVAKAQSGAFWERGFNDTYQVQCADGCYSLRVYRHAIRSRDDIEFEVAALNYLRRQDANIAYPIERKDGGYITEVQAPEGLRYVILTTYAAGAPLDYDEAENAKRFGESAATLHKLSENFTTTYKRKDLDLGYLLDESLDIVRPFLINRADDLSFVEQAAKDAHTVVGARSTEDFDRGFCHGDFHGGNAHQKDGVITHFDFDCCGFGLRIFDLATFFWSAGLSGKSEEHWPHFINGYQSVRRVSESELELLRTFVLIRHIWWIAFNLGDVADFGQELTSKNSIDYYIRTLKKVVPGDSD